MGLETGKREWETNGFRQKIERLIVVLVAWLEPEALVITESKHIGCPWINDEQDREYVTDDQSLLH